MAVVVAVLGLLLVLVGLWLLSPALVLVVGGVVMVAAALLYDDGKPPK